ncbi:penicillin-binding transpeptidase domain-containing protein [Thomasclavelia cocleata]|jgi:cell division protein FtsI/penicillin-binding protein 2|uniref:penicillin-binding transpeptidase domain-containing protein n=1 Tax=Thomasclavelia cocleata TaxID=69824 RepID=UPI00242E4D91|nr:penicillin-binding transpeptidase domain-containing protein [Thomasclavelia cocleata]MCI9130891.1 penicillin-binding transpeptidase domain-containing protein [Thomasclavelia cocleata]MCI9630665.1 penicillin-binding transpeptidase domain-containing protein [Thomasclavelia cocleata]
MNLSLKKSKVFIIGVAIIVIVTLIFFLFNRGKDAGEVVEEYYSHLTKKDYKKMYAMLTRGSLARTSQKVFETRYENIYDGIEAKNMKVKINEVNDNVVNCTISMDTIAGKVSYDNKITVKNDEIVFNEKMLFDGIEGENKVRVLTDNASRGKILDRNDKELATIGEAYSVGLVRGKLNGEGDYQAIADLLDMSVDKIKKIMSASWIKDDSFVPLKEIAKDDDGKSLADQLLAIKGVKLNTTYVRYYPYGEVTSHLTGYLQQVNAEDLEKHKNEGYSETSLIGRSGIEAAYEKDLKGIDGKKIIITDKDGKEIKIIANKRVKDGKDIKLTIDIDLQKDLYNEYQNDKSASVAMNPKTGEILALVSTPSFSSNDFILGFNSEQWENLNNDTLKPLTNRFKATYIPGSSMKPITGAIGLDAKKIEPNKDLGALDKWQKDSSWGNYYVTTLHAPTPNNLKNAIIYSDNVYFARSAVEIGKDELTSGYDKLKIGKKIPFELSLNLSQYLNKDSNFDDQKLADSGYGQGELLINPVQLASIYSSFVNEGNIFQPYLIIDQKPKSWIKSAFSKSTVNIIKEALIGVISDSNGTGHAIYHNDIELAGKTGTAELKSSQSDTNGTELGWFTVMTTNSDTPILITTMVEDVKDRGGSGYVVEHMKKPLGNYLY